MDVIVERPAALDVHKEQVTACVRVPDADGTRRSEVVEFSTMVGGLLTLRDWLKAGGTDPRLVLYPDQGHFLPRANVRERTVSFLKEISASACPASGAP